MKKIYAEILIKAIPEVVWHAVTDPDLYKQWARMFTAGSFFEGSWNEGEAIRFLTINKRGEREGMLAEIAASQYPRHISIRLLGYVYNDVEDTSSDEIRKWAPAYENYTLHAQENGHTLFSVEAEVTDDFYAMFTELWPKALEELKRVAERNAPPAVYPCIWFNSEAGSAAKYYCSIFRDSEMLRSNAMVSTFKLHGTKIMGLNGGPRYKPTGAVSYFIYCGGMDTFNHYFKELSAGGRVVLPAGKYGWSEHYAWVTDRYGVDWQLDVDDIRSPQKIVPTLLFVNEKRDAVRSAIGHYATIFSTFRNLLESPYPNSSAAPPPLLFAQFKINHFVMNAMSSKENHDFDFSPGNSFVIECNTQAEIDHYWDKLGEGGRFDQCGWLTDKFGISWQVVPAVLSELMNNPEKGERVIRAFLQMQKFDIESLLNA